MKGKKLKSYIEELLARGELRKAINAALVRFPDSLTFRQLSFRFHDIETKNINGLVNWHDYITERNRIAHALQATLLTVHPESIYRKTLRGRVHVAWIVVMAPFLDFTKIKPLIASLFYVVLTCVAVLTPIFEYQDPPPGQAGIAVNLTISDAGSNSPTSTNNRVSNTAHPRPPEKEKTKQGKLAAEQEPMPENPVKKEPSITEKKAVDALQIKREEEVRRKKAQEARIKAEQEARKEKERAGETKNKIGGLFGPSSRNKSTDTKGLQEDPNASNLEGRKTGSSKVGVGLGSRGLLSTPALRENSQKSGTVVIEICVDAEGQIIPSSVRYTNRGSDTNDYQLKSAAIANAKRWRFSKGTIDKQCGTITYHFKVQ